MVCWVMIKLCEIEGCNRKHKAKGLCRKHYNEQYRKDNKDKIAKRQKCWIEKHKEYISKRAKKYYQKKKEYISKRGKQYYQEHKEEKAKYHQNNKEHYAEYHKQHRKTLAGKTSRKASKHNYRALAKGLTKETIQRVYEDNIKKYGRLTCVLCFKPIEFGKDSLEHYIPLTRKGTNDYDNLGVAHFNCNSQKRTKTLMEWFEKRPNMINLNKPS